MEIIFKSIPAEKTFTGYNPNGQKHYSFTENTNPHEVPDEFGKYLIKDRPILFGRTEGDILKARGIAKPIRRAPAKAVSVKKEE